MHVMIKLNGDNKMSSTLTNMGTTISLASESEIQQAPLFRHLFPNPKESRIARKEMSRITWGMKSKSASVILELA